MRENVSLRGRLLGNLALLLVVLMLASGLSAYWNGREAADTAYDRTLLASARTIAAGLSQRDGSLSADVPYVALDTFAYDSAGRIYYQVLDINQRLISGYEKLPPPPSGTPRTDDYPALARFYDATYLGQNVRVVSLLKAVSEPNMNGMAEIRVAETDEARVSMARGLMGDTLLRLGMLALGALVMVWSRSASRTICAHCRWYKCSLNCGHWWGRSTTSPSVCVHSSSARRSSSPMLPTSCVRPWRRSKRGWNWVCAPMSRNSGTRRWKRRRRAPTN